MSDKKNAEFTPTNPQAAEPEDGVPEPGRIVARRVGPVGWFLLGLSVLAVLIVGLMLTR